MSREISHWRAQARVVAQKVVREHAGKGLSAVQAELRKAYPFGERRYWPYKVWCEEQRHALRSVPHFRALVRPVVQESQRRAKAQRDPIDLTPYLPGMEDRCTTTRPTK